MKEETKKSLTNILIALVIAAAIVGGGIALWKTDFLGMGGKPLPPEFQYDASLKTDPALIVGEQVGAIDTNMERPRGIAFRNGELYVAGEKEIRVFSLDGKQIERLFAGNDEPFCVTPSSDMIWFASKDRVGVIRGGAMRSFRPPILWPPFEKGSHITSLAVSGTDAFVADAGHRVVLHYNTDGKLINRIGEKDEARHIPGFIIPSMHMDVAVSKDKRLWVVNPGRHRLEKYTFEGELESSWGGYGPGVETFCGCCNPTDFAILPDGSFVTAEKGIPRVKLYSPEGKFVGVVAGPETFSKNLFSEEGPGMDLAVTDDGRILVLDPSLKQVRIFRITKKK